jgi:N-acetyl-gamma-glutamyl-phosphate reductase
MKIKAVIFGASGYSGAELTRLLAGHSGVELVAVGADSQAGQKVADIFPALKGVRPEVFEKLDANTLKGKAQAAFLALPHGESLQVAPVLLKAGLKVVDLSGDFRLKDPTEYQRWYGKPHTAPELLAEAVYGLPEFFAAEIKKAGFVANPGCYATSVTLALWPLLKAGLVSLDGLIVDSKSGVSGAGRKLSATTQFVEVHENFSAYKVGGAHQHIPEMEQTLALAAGCPVTLCFTPHLLPVKRGILTTAYAKLKNAATDEKALRAAYQQAYESAPFVRVQKDGQPLPSLRSVQGTNFCEIGLKKDERTSTVIVVACLDNLLKGAASHAVQNFNLMFGLDEKEGLDLAAPVI